MRSTVADFLDVVATGEYIADPYPYLRELRERGPAMHAGSDIWVVTRYADVARAIRDPALSNDFSLVESYAEYFRVRGIDARFPLPVNALDPPDHRRIRSMIAPAFSSAAVQSLAPMVSATIGEVVDSAVAGGRDLIDLVEDVAAPIPIAVIAQIFGLPRSDWPMLHRWSRDFGQSSDPDVLLSDEQRAAAAAATREAGAYFARLVASRRKGDGDDLVSRWLRDFPGQGAMSLPELLVNGVFLLIVGHHNTVSLICNGMLALLRHPGQLDLLRREPSLIGHAVEELLRYDGPVQTSTRVTTAPYEVDGVTVPARRQLMLLLGSANRDEAAFPGADSLDVRRPDAPRNLGLGRGMHACVGGPLARLQVTLTLTELLRRFPTISQAGPVRRPSPCFTLRAMSHFPLRVS